MELPAGGDELVDGLVELVLEPQLRHDRVDGGEHAPADEPDAQLVVERDHVGVEAAPGQLGGHPLEELGVGEADLLDADVPLGVVEALDDAPPRLVPPLLRPPPGQVLHGDGGLGGGASGARGHGRRGGAGGDAEERSARGMTAHRDGPLRRAGA